MENNDVKNIDKEKDLSLQVNAVKNFLGIDTLFASKLTPEHIAEMENHRHEENMLQLRTASKIPYFIIVGIFILFIIIAFLVWQLKDKEELLKFLIEKIIYIALGVFSGIGIDRTFLKKE